MNIPAEQGLQWNEFTEGDWMAFAGAQAFEGGEQPCLATITVDGEEMCILLDRTGLGIISADGDKDMHMGAGLWQIRALRLLTTNMTYAQLHELGFRGC